jgi:hypothetical protein
MSEFLNQLSFEKLPSFRRWHKTDKRVRDPVAGHDPGPITFRRRPTGKADETYPLKLTQEQQASMIHATRIKNKVKEFWS